MSRRLVGELVAAVLVLAYAAAQARSQYAAGYIDGTVMTFAQRVRAGSTL